jgi:hypothetical protein
MKAIAGLLIVLVLIGCATGEGTKTKLAPAQVTVYREPSPRDSFFPMLFMVDGRPIVRLYPDEEHRLAIEAGERRFGYELGVYTCSAVVPLESGKTYSYRLAQGCIIEPDDGMSGVADSSGESEKSNWQEQDRARQEAIEAQEDAEERSEQVAAGEAALRMLRGRFE